MSQFSRRNFLFVSSGSAAGSMLVPGLANADNDLHDHFAQSGLVTGQPKPLRHDSIPGFLSAEQIAPHHTAGKAIDAAAYGALERSRTSKGNSVILHELYFDGLVPKAPDPDKVVRTAIAKRFGSLEKWAAELLGEISTVGR